MEVHRFLKAFEEKYLQKAQGHLPANFPKITTGMMTGQLVFNSAALKLMGLNPGDRVFLLDLGAAGTQPDYRFFATKGFRLDEKWQGAKIHENGKIHHSVFYNTLISAGTITLIDNLLMVEKGYFEKYGKEKFRARKKVSLQLEKYTETTPEGTHTDLFIPAPGVSPQAFFRMFGRTETTLPGRQKQ